MMGYSLLNVDPEKEAALDAARDELSAAEDEWRILEAETDAELARAERMERRRLLLDEARDLLGRPGGRGATRWTSSGPCGCRRPSRPSWWSGCSAASTRAGVAVAGEELTRDELMLLAEAWLDEADEAATREQEHEAAQPPRDAARE